ncbi:bifunctional lysylphosphatidylglycerol flippase/synthetase MprF [Streptomyces polygonati]|uniref:Bifunctional lysylphosphatidylglycerol flippase/synthetase MprF n=1 Tax=Streptomyces polygonati TaxID=1617087 RepID=A0ABV8HKD2_9ACTN
MTDLKTSGETVLEAIREYTAADNPSAFLAVSEGNSYFTLPGRPGVVVYRPAGRFLVQLGGPFAPDDSYRDLLSGFRKLAAEQDRTVVSVQLQARDAQIYAESGFTVNQVGASYAVDLDSFTLDGTRFMQLRNKISRALRNGLTVVEEPYEKWRTSVEEIDRLWLPLKGEGARPLEYLVGQCGGEMQQHRRLFVGHVDGQMAGYILYSPVYGSRPGWMHDLSRRRPGKSPGIMEAINKAAIDVFRQEEVRWLHFGFTPFTGLDDKLELPGSSPGFTWFMHFLWEHGEGVYPAVTQLAYKEKWNQSLVLPEYVAFDGEAGINAFVHVFRAANAL